MWVCYKRKRDHDDVPFVSQQQHQPVLPFRNDTTTFKPDIAVTLGMTTEAVSPTADLDDIKVEVDHHEDSKGEDGPDVPDDDPRWLTGWKLWLSLLGMMFGQYGTYHSC